MRSDLARITPKQLWDIAEGKPAYSYQRYIRWTNPNPGRIRVRDDRKPIFLKKGGSFLVGTSRYALQFINLVYDAWEFTRKYFTDKLIIQEKVNDFDLKFLNQVVSLTRPDSKLPCRLIDAWKSVTFFTIRRIAKSTLDSRKL